MTSKFVFVYITNPSLDIAKKIAVQLVENRLIACANIIDSVTSIYRWKGNVAEERECVLIGKTTEDNYPAIRTLVKKVHPYKVPCILKIPIEGNKEYLDWLTTEVKP